MDDSSISNFSRETGAQAQRKLRAKQNSAKGVWFGLGMMGLVGWSVVIPTLLGAALGLWIDERFPSPFSWTLMLLLGGLLLGCLNAWHWVAVQDQEMREEQQ